MSTPEYREGKLQEEIDRLTRLCEAQDMDNRRMNAGWHDANSETLSVKQQLSEAQAQVAMQAEALNAVFNATPPGTHYCSPDMQLVKEALTFTSETVAAWRAKETEPLRREVARLTAALHKIIDEGDYTAPEGMTRVAKDAISSDQATTLAYEREVENRGAVKALGESQRENAELARKLMEQQAALDWWEDLVSESRGVSGFHKNGDIAEWDEFEIPRCAANKGAVK